MTGTILVLKRKEGTQGARIHGNGSFRANRQGPELKNLKAIAGVF